MEFVLPLRIQIEAPRSARLKHANVVQIALGNDPSLASQARGLLMKTVAQLGQDVPCAEIENAVNRVQPQRVDVIFGQPIKRVVDHESPDAVAPGPSKLMARPHGVR